MHTSFLLCLHQNLHWRELALRLSCCGSGHVCSLTPRSRSGLLCRCPGVMWEPIRKRAHMQLVRGHSFGHNRLSSLSHSQLVEPLWTHPGIKSGISVRKLHFQRKRKKSTDGERMVEHSPKISHDHHVCSGHFVVMLSIRQGQSSD